MEFITKNTNINQPGKSNQDRGFSLSLDKGTEIRCVLDGHGFNQGQKFSSTTRNYLMSEIKKNQGEFDKDDLEPFLTILISKCELHLKEQLGHLTVGGSTFSIVIVRPERDIVTANLGDSSVCLYQSDTWKLLTREHGPTSKDEFIRIHSEFPQVRFIYEKLRYDGLPEHPVFELTGNFNENSKPNSRNSFLKNREGEYATYLKCNFPDGDNSLAMSRCLGDFKWKEVGVSSKPSICKYEYPKESFKLIIATDGFWDCWTQEELVKFLSTEDISTLDKAHSKNAKKYFGSSVDDTFAYTYGIDIVSDSEKHELASDSEKHDLPSDSEPYVKVNFI